VSTETVSIGPVLGGMACNALTDAAGWFHWFAWCSTASCWVVIEHGSLCLEPSSVYTCHTQLYTAISASQHLQSLGGGASEEPQTLKKCVV